jgi:hypothetical protein
LIISGFRSYLPEKPEDTSGEEGTAAESDKINKREDLFTK